MTRWDNPSFTQKFGAGKDGVRKFLEHLDAERNRAIRRRRIWMAVATVIWILLFVVFLAPFFW